MTKAGRIKELLKLRDEFIACSHNCPEYAKAYFSKRAKEHGELADKLSNTPRPDLKKFIV